MTTLPARVGWLTVLSLAAVAAVNLAGAWQIAAARRVAAEEAGRVFAVETASRARALEGRLSATRADLGFLATSDPIAGLAPAPESGDPRWRRAGAESALLLFLRGHPEVIRLVVRSPRGEPLVQTGRRGGVPVLWVSASPTGEEGAALDPRRPRLTTRLSGLEAEIAPSALLPSGEDRPADAPACRLRDGAGTLLAHSPRLVSAPARSGDVTAEGEVAAEGWSAPSPWTLACAQPKGLAASLVEPVAARYRTTLILNLVVMGLAFLLGGFAVQQARRRERLEGAAREEVRVRELERQLFHAERLTTVGRLAAGIAHEINNPLEGMGNYLSLAREELARGDGEGAERHLTRVREGLERIAAVVRQVLAHADPATAPQIPVDLNQVLKESGEFVSSRPEFGQIRLRLELNPGPLLVRASPVMLGQVAVNLVLNACEAQPRGGEVNLRSRREGAQALAEIADRGPGVAPADRQRIFEPFYSTKDSTGLGLSICHSIVRQHQGQLTVLPREGGGAIFRLALPALEA
jgi:signal transduction histidine kinase